MSVRLEQLLANATPGPWRTGARWQTIQGPYMQAVEGADGLELGHSWFMENDAALVAKTPDMARLLIDMGEALRACHHDFDPTEDECSVCTPLLARLDALGKDTA